MRICIAKEVKQLVHENSWTIYWLREGIRMSFFKQKIILSGSLESLKKKKKKSKDVFNQDKIQQPV